MFCATEHHVMLLRFGQWRQVCGLLAGSGYGLGKVPEGGIDEALLFRTRNLCIALAAS